FSSLTLDHIGYWTDLFYAIIRKRTQLKINHSRLSQFEVLLQPLKDDDALVRIKKLDKTIRRVVHAIVKEPFAWIQFKQNFCFDLFARVDVRQQHPMIVIDIKYKNMVRIGIDTHLNCLSKPIIDVIVESRVELCVKLVQCKIDMRTL
ncbi:hypothetical protein BpHYR1_015112, partial [Brachionus plicatilis]